MLRGGEVELALRDGGAVTVRGGVTPLDGAVGAPVRPFSTWIPLVFMVDEAAEEDADEEFVFTKRRSTGSKAIVEWPSGELARIPDWPSTKVLETRIGGAVTARLPFSASRGGDFNVSHFCAGATARSCERAPFIRTPEPTPRSTFKAACRFSSTGSMDR